MISKRFSSSVTQKPTLMELESRETPFMVERQLNDNQPILDALCQRIRQEPPEFVVTIGRGSSDHACTFAKYLFETRCQWVSASAAPSVTTLYHAKLDMEKALVIGISQSGKSPDICEMMQAARASGGLTVAIVNEANSPLAQSSEYVIPMRAGVEKAVAATKSYIASLVALTHLVATLTQDKTLLPLLPLLPEKLNEAIGLDWSDALKTLQPISRTFVIARGYGFPIAQEAALKLKETTGIQAEAFSAAEVLHGPFALVRSGQPFILFAQNDSTIEGVIEMASRILSQGGIPLIATARDLKCLDAHMALKKFLLDLPESLHPILDSIVTIQAFYCMVARLAVARGYNPDAPLNLKKVTETR